MYSRNTCLAAVASTGTYELCVEEGHFAVETCGVVPIARVERRMATIGVLLARFARSFAKGETRRDEPESRIPTTVLPLPIASQARGMARLG